MYAMMKQVRIKDYERGLLFRDGDFKELLGPGKHWVFGRPGSFRVDVLSKRLTWITHDQLDVLAHRDALKGEAEVLEIADHERALVWLDGRFERVLQPGRYAYWKGFREVRVERVDTHTVRFEHRDLQVIAKTTSGATALDIVTVRPHHVGVLFQDGTYADTLAPGRYAFWRGAAEVEVMQVDQRELTVDIAGQEIMTADKVSLRMNAILRFVVADVVKAVSMLEDPRQALYRDAQLALRAAVGAVTLDDLLANKDALSSDLDRVLREKGAAYGLRVVGTGVRDIILPGEMRELLNRVTEAKKAAEANLITRREETAAMRSQMNTAKMLENNPTLMRLRELETLTKIAETSTMQVVLGEKGLSDRVTNLL